MTMFRFINWLFGGSPNVIRVVVKPHDDGPLAFPAEFAKRVNTIAQVLDDERCEALVALANAAGERERVIERLEKLYREERWAHRPLTCPPWHYAKGYDPVENYDAETARRVAEAKGE